MNIQRLLVPTDFSDMSNEAFKAAEYFAHRWNAKVTPLHAPDSGEASDGNLIEKLNKHATQFISKEHLEDGIIAEKKPLDGINEAAENTDIVLMGTHGRTGFSRLLLGSVAERVVRTCPKPVIVVENAEFLSKNNTILVTTDFSDYSFEVFPYVNEIAGKLGCDIELINILSYEQHQKMTEIHGTQSKLNRRLNELVDKNLQDVADRVNTEVILSNRSVHEEITRLTINRSYNMVMLATLGWSGLDYLRLGSTASNVVRHVEIPVFTINPRTKN